MVCDIFYNSETAKRDINITISEKFIGVLRYFKFNVFIIFNIPIHY